MIRPPRPMNPVKPVVEKPPVSVSTTVAPTLVSPLDHALYYGSLGWKIVANHTVLNGKCSCEKKEQCGNNSGKHPRVGVEWNKKATSDPHQLREWFGTFWPRANVALLCGPESDVFVVDIDTKDRGIETWNEWVTKYGEPKPTPTSLTGNGGFHRFYKWPSSIIVPSRAQFISGIGIDLRGKGGAATLPPSINLGGQYQWKPGFAPWDLPLAEPEMWLLDMISSVQSNHSMDSERVDLIKALAGTGEGERNQVLFQFASSLRARNIAQDTAMMWLLQAADNCTPAYPHKDAIDIVRRVYQNYQPGTSWKVQTPYRSFHTIQQQEEWQEPIDFDEAHLPDFPLQAFPGWIRNYVEAVAETTQTPKDMGALLSLSALATACQRKVEIRMGDWTEPLNLYTVTCAAPGERKSSVFRHIMLPIYEFEEFERMRQEETIAKAQAGIEMLELEYKDLRNKAAKEKNIIERDKLQTEAAQKKIDAERLKRECIALDLTGDDITPENLKTKLFEQKGRFAVLSPEGDIFGMMNGRYQKNGVNIDVYLKGHAGDDIEVNRMSRAEHVKKPTLTLGICTQKKSLRGWLAMSELANRGLFARFLYAMKPEEYREENLDPLPIPLDILEAYRSNMRRLFHVISYCTDLENNESNAPRILALSDGALAVMRAYRQHLNKERQSRNLFNSDELQQWAKKLAGAVARIAGLLHLAENVHEEHPYEFEMTEATMQNAWLIGMYLIPHVISAHHEMVSSLYYDVAKKILAYMQRIDKDVLTHQDAVQATKMHGRTLENALMLLTEYGYIRPKNPLNRTTSYLINEKWNRSNPIEDPDITESEGDV